MRDGVSSCPTDNPVDEPPTLPRTPCAFPDLKIYSKKLIFFEPIALRNQLDFSLQISTPFTEYPNIVFAPHVYTSFFTAPHWPPSFALALDSAWWEAKGLNASVLVTEYGGPSEPESDAVRVDRLTQQFDEAHGSVRDPAWGTSGTMWDWKERGSWSLFEPAENKTQPNGVLRQNRVRKTPFFAKLERPALSWGRCGSHHHPPR